MGCGASKPAPVEYTPSSGTMRRIETTERREEAKALSVEKIKPLPEPEKGEPKDVLRKLFKDLDADNSESVTASLLVNCMRQDRRVSLALKECGGEDLLTKLDANKDGTVTWVEFEAGLGVVSKPTMDSLAPSSLFEDKAPEDKAPEERHGLGEKAGHALAEAGHAAGHALEQAGHAIGQAGHKAGEAISHALHPHHDEAKASEATAEPEAAAAAPEAAAEAAAPASEEACSGSG